MSETRVPGFGARVWHAITQVVVKILTTIGVTLAGILTQIERWLIGPKRASYGFAVTRIVLGCLMLGEVVLSEFRTLTYVFGSGAAWNGQFDAPVTPIAGIWPFSVVVNTARTDAGVYAIIFVIIILAALFTVGYRTRLVLIPLAILWIGYCNINYFVIDQSTNLIRIALTAFLFAGLSDRWSLDARRRLKYANRPVPKNPVWAVVVRWWRFQKVLPEWIPNLAHNLVVVVMICQLCFVYAGGGLFKTKGTEWANGTGVYDPLYTTKYGPWPELSDLVTFWGPVVAVLSIGTVLLQVSFPFMLLNRFTRIIALFGLLSFHIGIGVLMGLPWFSLAMIALDAILIRDVSWRRVEIMFRRFVRDVRGTPTRNSNELGTGESVEISLPGESVLSEKVEEETAGERVLVVL